MIRRHKTLEWVPNEHELEVFLKSSLPGNGRQFGKCMQVAVDSRVVREKIARGAVRLR